MKDQDNRKLTVCYANGSYNNFVPLLKLQGKWMEALGFSIGDKVTVECHRGRLIITKAESGSLT